MTGTGAEEEEEEEEEEEGEEGGGGYPSCGRLCVGVYGRVKR